MMLRDGSDKPFAPNGQQSTIPPGIAFHRERDIDGRIREIGDKMIA